MYDICIIGAGIAGLYCAREIQKKMPDAKICILEKFKNIGGRLYTFHTTVNGQEISWEAGAGRIHKSHHNVWKLLKEYGIDTIPITGGVEWRTPEGSRPVDFMKLLQNLEITRIPEKDLESKTLKELFTEIMGQKKTSELMNQYEYRSELDTLKASKALESLQHELGHQSGFSVIKGGFSLLIDKLKHSIPKVTILTEHEVIDIQENKVLLKGKKPIMASKVIVAIQRDAAVKLPCLQGLPIMEQVKMRPLVRMYAVFPCPNGKAWFAGIQKFLCDLPIRYVLPMDPTKGTIMISYTDGPEAEYWIKQKNPEPQVMKQIRSLFPTIEIPDPLFFKVHPWADGCSYWAPGPHGAYDFNKVSKASVKPLPDVPNLYMCNESWAYEQCWVKCSIDQAQKVIDIIE
ncbi:MAG: FAD-dependent oxidoreductase [Bacteroidetes bacterium]|nr:FAD-dependent oxidoreductase [Bacteroidota bacterium]